MAVETRKAMDMKFNFAAEVYTNISAANVFISYDNGKEGGVVSSVKVKLHKDFLIISISETDNVVHQLKITAPENYFIPLSFYSVYSNMALFDETESGLLVAEYVNGNLNEPSSSNMSVSFRVQINSSPNEPQSTACGTYAFKEPESDVAYKVSCRQCMASLRDGPISFKKVTPVLGDPMEVITESFFCHAHDNGKYPVPSQQENDLLFTYNYYCMCCLHNDRLSYETGSRNVYCAGCRSFLGNKQSRKINCDADVLLCFKDKVVFSAVDEVPLVWPSVSDTSLSLLLDIIDKTQMHSMTCKLVLEVKISPSSAKCLLLWVMSLNMKLYRTQQSKPSLQLEEKLSLEPVMKVLYHEARPNSEAIRSWMHQFAVDYYVISDTMMQEILKILSKSSAGIPACEDMTPSFNVGYLPVRI